MSEVSLSLQGAQESVRICPTADTRSRRLGLHGRILAETETELASVLPVEGSLGRDVIQQRIEMLKHTIENPTFEELYPKLGMEVLGWRDEQGFPKLVPFPLTNPVFSIKAVVKNWMASRENVETRGTVKYLPPPMGKMYDDVFAKFWDECQEDEQEREFEDGMTWNKSITTRFSGVIPQWVREKIHAASDDFSVSTQSLKIKKTGWLRRRDLVRAYTVTNIFLIAEVDKWVVDKEVVLAPDPLVVGYKGGCLWLICSFDETPLEEYARWEFTD